MYLLEINFSFDSHNPLVKMVFADGVKLSRSTLLSCYIFYCWCAVQANLIMHQYTENLFFYWFVSNLSWCMQSRL